MHNLQHTQFHRSDHARGYLAITLLSVSVAAGVIAASSVNQSSSIDWYAVEAGGGTAMTGNGIEIVGNAGQAVAGSMFGGGIEIVGGFGAGYTGGENTWVGGLSGSFNDSTQWADGTVPDTYDSVIFNAQLPVIAVSFPEDASFGRLLVHESIINFNFSNTNVYLLDDSAALPSLVVGQLCNSGTTLELFNSGNALHGLVAGSVSIGETACSTGTLRVRGNNTSFTNNGDIWIGRRGNGIFDVFNGGQAFSNGSVSIGTDAGSSGRAVINGSNSRWETFGGGSANFVVGDSGIGRLEILNGATVTTSGFNEITVGATPESIGRVEIIGAGSEWIVDHPVILVGGNGVGDILVDNGGLLTYPQGVTSGLVPLFVLGSNGSLGGVGTVNGNVLSFGDLYPGRSDFLSDLGHGSAQAGQLVINGNYEQVGAGPGNNPVTGNMHIGLGANADQLKVTGIARIGGGLFVDLLPGANPVIHESFSILAAGQLHPVNDRFDVAFMPGLTEGRVLRVEYPNNAAATGGIGANITVESLSGILGFEVGGEFDLSGLATSIAVGDFDGVNGLDIAVTIPGPTPLSAGEVLILFNDGSGFDFTPAIYTVGREPSDIVVDDFNGNGFPDIAVTNEGEHTVTVLLNDGTGVFNTITTVNVGLGPSAITAGAFRGGDEIDLAVTSRISGTVHILANDGDGGFPDPPQVYTVGAQPSAIASGANLLGTGLIDLAIANEGDNTVTILANTGNGFTPHAVLAVDLGPVGIDIEDLDNNKTLDIVVINSTSDNVSIINSEGGGNFAPAVNLPLRGTPRSMALWDMNITGFADLAIVVDDPNLGLLVRILRNDSINGQIIFSKGIDQQQGESPILVTSGDMTGNRVEDLITVNANQGTALGGPPSSVVIQPNESEPLPPQIPGDLNGDGVVNVSDLLILLGNWGPCVDCDKCVGDLNDDCIINVSDLLELLANWG
jgi:T5SS/PEP-CTERM-associated repeat protein